MGGLTAREVVTACLRDAGDRWLHIVAVGSLADSIAGLGDVVRSAAWLHDVGYAAVAVRTGFHPLDGATYLEGLGWSSDVVGLVAHHSGATVEAEERGLLQRLERWPAPDSMLLDLVNYCDLTTGPQGTRVTVGARIEEILRRYDPDHPVHRAVTRSAPELVESVKRAEAWLASPVVREQ